MFLVQLTYKAPLNEVDKFLQAHREFLDVYYMKGLLMVSGPMKPRTGGIILALTNDRVYLESIFKQDPYYLAEIADYQFIEFQPVKCQEAIKPFIQKSEGELC